MVCYHVGLPAFHVDTAIDAPPEVVFWLTLPCEYTETYNDNVWKTGKKNLTEWCDRSWEKDRCHTQESHLPLPGQLPLHSGWSRCCRLPICTEPPKLTESPSAPEETEKRQVWLLAVDDATLYYHPLCLCAVCLQLTAVWAVMWVQPTTLAPARGFSPWARFRRAIRAGISKRGDGNKSARSLRNSHHLIHIIHR